MQQKTKKTTRSHKQHFHAPKQPKYKNLDHFSILYNKFQIKNLKENSSKIWKELSKRKGTATY